MKTWCAILVPIGAASWSRPAPIWQFGGTKLKPAGEREPGDPTSIAIVRIPWIARYKVIDTVIAWRIRIGRWKAVTVAPDAHVTRPTVVYTSGDVVPARTLDAANNRPEQSAGTD